MSLRHKKMWAALALSLLLCCAQGSLAQKQKEQNKSDKSPLHVRLNVTVLDADNRPVSDAAREDFQLFENETPQTITEFSTHAGSLRYGLVIDCSGSLRTQIDSVIKASKAIVSNTKPEDEAFLLRFVSSDKITLEQDWTSSRAQLERALDNLYPEGGASAIVDAVYKAAEHIVERRKVERMQRRDALILITDGQERASSHTLSQLLQLLRDTNLQVFAIGLTQENRKQAESFLNTLANETGGRAFFLNSASELPQVTSEITMELGAQYLVGYDSTNGKRDGSFRKVRVRLGDKRTALARPGYTAPK
ncbi:MAG: VWA domain-containing protein [Acidobacteria bacterium]|nr:VWA domain-containing protein [Acidobacteriota bacterium]